MTQETHYTITLSASQLQAIGAALQEAPFRIAAPIVTALQKQIAEIEAKRAADQSIDQEAA